MKPLSPSGADLREDAVAVVWNALGFGWNPLQF